MRNASGDRSRQMLAGSCRAPVTVTTTERLLAGRSRSEAVILTLEPIGMFGDEVEVTAVIPRWPGTIEPVTSSQPFSPPPVRPPVAVCFVDVDAWPVVAKRTTETPVNANNTASTGTLIRL